MFKSLKKKELNIEYLLHIINGPAQEQAVDAGMVRRVVSEAHSGEVDG